MVRPNRFGITSKLQEEILRFIYTNPESDYDGIAEHTRRNRRTIGKSVQSLEKNHYVEKQTIKEGKNRSKYIVSLTFKGICYGLAYLKLRLHDYLEAYSHEYEKSPLVEHLQKIGNCTDYYDYIENNSKLYFENNLFNDGMPPVMSFRDALGIGVKIGLSDAANSKLSTQYFAKQGIGIARDILSPRQLYEFKCLIEEMSEGITNGLSEEIKKWD
jgi:hypothetical protein